MKFYKLLALAIASCVFFNSPQILASGSQHSDHDHDHDHGNLEAHVHGQVKLLIAVEKNIVDILMEGSADSFVGFEHRPKTKAEVAAYSKFYDAWTKSNHTIFQFPKEFNCKVKGATTAWKGKKTDQHKNLVLSAKYLCQPAIEKAELQLHLKPHFSRVNQFEIDVLPLKIMPYTKEAKNLKKTKTINLKL